MAGSHHHGEECDCGCHEGHGYHESDCGCGGHGGEEREEQCGCGGHHGHHQEQHHGPHHHDHCSCGCHHSPGCRCEGEGRAYGFQRRFRSRVEQVAELEAYLKELEAEAQGVRERMEELRSGMEKPQA
jgi:hypothetical protein